MKVLVGLPNWIGDVVMATPALRAIRAGFARDEIVAVGRAPTIPMLEPARWFDRAIPAPGKGGGALRPIRFGRALARERFDVAILLPNSWSSLVEAVAARIPRRIGYGKDGRGLFLTDRLTSVKIGRLRPVPMTDYYLALCAVAGCPVEGTGRELELPSPPEALERAAAWRARNGLAADERPIGFNVGAGFGGSKLWPTPSWAALAEHFLGAGRRVVVFGGPAEEPLVRSILGAIRRPGAIPALDVPLADLCAHMKGLAALVSTDSGLRHIGVAAGIPVVAIMGPTHPNYSEVGCGRYAVLLEKVECWPCHLKECPIDHRCMTRLAPERAIEAVEDFLAGRTPFGGARPWVTRAGEEGAHFA